MLAGGDRDCSRESGEDRRGRPPGLTALASSLLCKGDMLGICDIVLVGCTEDVLSIRRGAAIMWMEGQVEDIDYVATTAGRRDVQVCVKNEAAPDQDPGIRNAVPDGRASAGTGKATLQLIISLPTIHRPPRHRGPQIQVK